MSKYISEIIQSIKKNPDNWTKHDNGCGIKHKTLNIKITNIGNSAILSVSEVYIDDCEVITTYIDCFRIERVVKWWYGNIGLTKILEN